MGQVFSGARRGRRARWVVRDGRVGRPPAAGREPLCSPSGVGRAQLRVDRDRSRVAPRLRGCPREDRSERDRLGSGSSSPRRCAATSPGGRQVRSRTRRSAGSTSHDTGDPKEPADYREGSAFEFTLTIVSEDLDAMLSDPEHPAKMVGTVRARMLSQDALTVTDGVFNLFTTDPARPGEKRMRYRMLMTDPDDHVYSFEGYKVIRDDPGVDIWADTTTLYVTIHDGARSDGDPIAKGILRIRPRDFMRQLTTMQAVNAPNVMAGSPGEGAVRRLLRGSPLRHVRGAPDLGPRPSHRSPRTRHLPSGAGTDPAEHWRGPPDRRAVIRGKVRGGRSPPADRGHVSEPDPAATMTEAFDAIVIGSGFGGAVVACRSGAGGPTDRRARARSPVGSG